MKNLPYCKTPCKECPFRKDTLKGWLGADRMSWILNQGSFVCHKTTNVSEKDRLQCAGHMVIKGTSNDFVRLAKSLKLKTPINRRELIFETEQDAIKHHAN